VQFAPDRDEVISRARAAGLKWMLSIGTGEGPPDLACAIRLAEQHEPVLATIGVHPNDAPKATEQTFRDLEPLLEHPKVRAVGEIGLDYHWGVPKDVQMPVFLKQLEIASAARKPIVIHTRDAWEDTMQILRTHWAGNGLPCVMHCFTGTVAQARECIELDFYIAFGGVTTFPKSGALRDACKVAPANRLLLETDCPYLAPVPYRGKRNEPAFVKNTANTVALTRGISVEELAAQTTANFERLFVGESASYTEVSLH
jgi:TatD DNase family protein